jgi:hypothetical protein
MVEKNIPVTYVLFPDEGHGFARPNNSLAFNAVTEAFLAVHLGGRFEAIGNAFEGSTITVPTGAEGVPGLAENLPKPAAAKPGQESGAVTTPAVEKAVEKAEGKAVEPVATPMADTKEAPKK